MFFFSLFLRCVFNFYIYGGVGAGVSATGTGVGADVVAGGAVVAAAVGAVVVAAAASSALVNPLPAFDNISAPATITVKTIDNTVTNGNVHAYNQHPPTHIHCKAYRKAIDVNVPSVKYDTLNPNETVLIIIPINDIIPQNIVLQHKFFKTIII